MARNESITPDTAVATAPEKALARKEKPAFILDMPYGKLHIESRFAALDQATMRASQLSGLLTMVNGDSGEGFDSLNSTLKSNLLWLAQQMAEEVEALLPILGRGSEGEQA
jgi:hypothetical protein